jgi:hypothetical protein
VHDYVGISVPPKFNIRVNVFPDKLSSAEINTLNGSIIRTTDISNNSIIDFYEITTAHPLDPISLLLKSPDVIVNGQIHFARSNFDLDFNYVDMPLDTEGILKSKIAFVDDYEQTYENGTTKLQFVTFLQSISLNRTTYDSGITFEPPGDISHYAKRYGPQIPLNEAILSYSNFVLLLSICIVSIIGSWLIWPRIKFRTTEDNRNKLG